MLRIEAGAPLEGVVEVWNTVWPTRPVDLAELRHEIDDFEPEQQPTNFGAWENGTLVGVLRRYRDLGAFHPQRWVFECAVIPAHRGMGVGTALYDHVLEDTLPRGIIQIMGMVQEDDEGALSFVEKRGYKEVKRDFFSCLQVQDFDDKAWQNNESGCEIVSLQSVFNEETLKALHQTFETIRVDIPRAAPPTPLSYEFYRDKVLGDPAFRPDLSRVAFCNRTLAGFSTVFDGASENTAFQGLTGVRREFRGKGLATQLKRAVVLACKSAGLTELHTDNDTRNAPILAINQKFGFARGVATITVAKDLP